MMKAHLAIATLSLSLLACGELEDPTAIEASTEPTSASQAQTRTELDERADALETRTDAEQFEREVIEWVNDVRASGADCGEHGVFPPARPMRSEVRLADSARRHSVDMARHDHMSHEGSDGSRFWDRADRAGYGGMARGENVAVGYPSPEEVVQAWVESDGHCLVLMLPETTEIGVGYAFRDDTRYGHFWTLVTGID